MRVLRLLLAGTQPERILALTYTKAAAAEMSKRVFDTLAQWVTHATRQAAQTCSPSCCGRAADASRDAARAHAVRDRHRDAGRPQGADHPRVLRAPAAALPAGSRRGAGLHHSRRAERASTLLREADRRRAGGGDATTERLARADRRSRPSIATPPRSASTSLLRDALARARLARGARCASKAAMRTMGFAAPGRSARAAAQGAPRAPLKTQSPSEHRANSSAMAELLRLRDALAAAANSDIEHGRSIAAAPCAARPGARVDALEQLFFTVKGRPAQAPDEQRA